MNEGINVLRYPRWAPKSGLAGFRSFTHLVRSTLLKSTLNRLGFSDPIVWYSQPGMFDMLEAVPSPSLKIYHVVDEYSAYSGQTPYQKKQTNEHERKMLTRVDAVIVVSQELYRIKRPYNPHTYLVPNAVDYELYQAALDDPVLPDALARIPQPRLGYTGLISDKLDYEILLNLARKHPQWSLVFLGTIRLAECRQVWETLINLPNVYHLDAVDVLRVPHYIKGFQVGLMPNLQNRFAENCSPLKLYDYLAAGIPVASMDILPARPFASHIHLAPTPGDFEQAVCDALADTAPARRQERRQAVARETWEIRAQELSQIIVDRLAAKRSNDRSIGSHALDPTLF